MRSRSSSLVTALAVPVLVVVLASGLAHAMAGAGLGQGPARLANGVLSSADARAHGGLSGPGPVLGSGWTNVTGGHGPSPRFGAAVGYDARDGTTILFGGTSPSAGELNDTWSYAGGTWTDLTPGLATSPPPAGSDLFAYDAADGYLLLYQGSSGSSWTFSLDHWNPVTGPGPSARWHASMAYDNATQSVVLFGGALGASSPTNETWEFSSGAWTNDTASVSGAPSARWGAALAFDPTLPPGGGLRLFGGYNGTYLNDTWTFSSTHWTRTVPPGVGVSGRWGASFVFDPLDQAVLLFGGMGAGGPTNDTWLYTPSRWSLQSTPVGPPTRSDAGASLDDGSGAPLVFGGLNGSTARNDTWAWGGAVGALGVSASSRALPAAIDLGGSFTASAKAVGGTMTYVYAWKGVPAGCSAGNVASFTCTPTATGTYLLDLSVTDGGGRSASAVPVLIIVAADLRLAALTAVPPSLPVGSTTVLEASPSGGVLPWTFSYAGLPSGCLSANSANLTCVPTAAGNSSVAVTVHDDAGGVATSSVTIEVTSIAPPSVSLTTPSGPAWVGVRENVSALVTGGLAPFQYAWTVNDQPVLDDAPLLVWTPSAAGSFTLNVSVTDAAQRAAQASATVQVQIAAPPLSVGLSSSSTSLPSGGTVSLRATSAGGTAPYRYTWSLNGQNTTGGGGATWTLLLTGPATDTISVWVTDASGAVARSGTVTLTVSAPTTPSSPSSGISTAQGTLAVGALGALGAILLGLGLVRRTRAKGGQPSKVAAGAASEEGPTPPPPEPAKSSSEPSPPKEGGSNDATPASPPTTELEGPPALPTPPPASTPAGPTTLAGEDGPSSGGPP